MQRGYTTGERSACKRRSTELWARFREKTCSWTRLCCALNDFPVLPFLRFNFNMSTRYLSFLGTWDAIGRRRRLLKAASAASQQRCTKLNVHESTEVNRFQAMSTVFRAEMLQTSTAQTTRRCNPKRIASSSLPQIRANTELHHITHAKDSNTSKCLKRFGIPEPCTCKLGGCIGSTIWSNKWRICTNVSVIVVITSQWKSAVTVPGLIFFNFFWCSGPHSGKVWCRHIDHKISNRIDNVKWDTVKKLRSYISYNETCRRFSKGSGQMLWTINDNHVCA